MDGPGNRAVKPAIRECVKLWIEAGYSAEDVALGCNLCVLTVRRLNYTWGLKFGKRRLPRRWHRAMGEPTHGVEWNSEAQWKDFEHRETESPTPTTKALQLTYPAIEWPRRLVWWNWIRGRQRVKYRCWLLGQELKKNTKTSR